MNIVILSTAPFPDGSASATYILNVCRTMVASGHGVTVVGCRRSKSSDFPMCGEYDGIKYINFDAQSHGKVAAYLYDRYFEVYARYILGRLKSTDMVMLYGGTLRVAKAIRRYCRRNKKIFGTLDCEWYTEDCFADNVPSWYSGGKVMYTPYVARNADRSILISTLLESYYRENGVRTVMIPNIVDLTDAKWNVRKTAAADKLKLAYAGSPSVGKDDLGVVVQAICALPEEKRRDTELHVYGPDEKSMLAYLKICGMDEIPPCVVCHGRQKQDRIPALLNECHFTVLVRKPTLRNNAGFSTKMVESFAAGIPFIANITGDIATYLKDGENGIVIADESVEACRDALIRAWDILDKNPEMRENAYKTAQDNFDYRIYIEDMRDFLANA